MISVAEQDGLCPTWSQTPKTGFLMTRFVSSKACFLMTYVAHYYAVLLFSELSKAELAQENLQLQEQTREMRRKCAVIRDLIDVLQKNYESSKSLAFLHRYMVLKRMIKTVIHDNLVWQML